MMRQLVYQTGVAVTTAAGIDHYQSIETIESGQ